MSRLISTVAVAAIVIVSYAQFGNAASVLLHEYPFTNGAQDFVGSANGTLQNGASASGGVLTLNGSNQSVTFSQYLIPSSNFSITFYAQTNFNINWYTEIISQGYSGAPGFYIGTAPGGNFRFGDLLQNTHLAFPTNGLTNFFALTSGSASGTLFYINGILAFSSPTVVTAPQVGAFTTIGSQFSGFGEYFPGKIEDLRIYSGVLTGAEVSAAATPLPAALPLFATGLGALGLLGWRRKRKAAALAA